MTCQASGTPTDGCYCACCGQPAQAASADWVGKTRRSPIAAQETGQESIAGRKTQNYPTEAGDSM